MVVGDLPFKDVLKKVMLETFEHYFVFADCHFVISLDQKEIAPNFFLPNIINEDLKFWVLQLLHWFWYFDLLFIIQVVEALNKVLLNLLLHIGVHSFMLRRVFIEVEPYIEKCLALCIEWVVQFFKNLVYVFLCNNSINNYKSWQVLPHHHISFQTAILSQSITSIPLEFQNLPRSLIVLLWIVHY